MTVEAMLRLLHAPAEAPRAPSPFLAARERRRLTVEDAAERAGLTPEEVAWLEEGRVYRFPSTDAALAAAVVLAAALEIDLREARGLARESGVGLRRRLGARLPVVLAAVAVAAAAGALAAAVALPRPDAEETQSTPVKAAAPENLPPPWTIRVDVLNGSGDIVRTRGLASRIGALAYTIRHVGRADSFRYPQTAVYYESGGRANAIRLARQLGVVTKPLPGGTNPRRLVVVVGAARGPAQ
jgi:transcriptional regulator with XRE-family HTH domain